MATEFISNSWLMPTNANEEANRLSNFSLDFDGSSQYVSLNEVIYSGAFTFSFWLKPDNLTLAFITGDINSNSHFVWLNSSTKIYLKASGSTFIFTESAGNDITIGSWQNIIITRDASNNVNCYRNGVAFGGTGVLSGDFKLNSIGQVFSGIGNWFFNGSMTEVSIFDYSLSASQVTQLYGTGSAIGNPMAITNGRKPVAYYPLGNAAFNGEFLVPNGAEQDYVFDFAGSAKINYSTPVDLGVVSTFSFWMNIDTGTTGALFGNTDVVNPTYEYVVYYAGSAFYFKIAGAYADFPNAASAISTGQWHHVAFVRPSENEVKCYIDSVLTDTITSWSGTPGSNPIKFDLIGSRPGGGLDYSGKITEISGFNTALPATGTESVQSLYNYGTPPNIASYSNLQAWYELNASATFDGSNWSIPDASSNSNTGTSSGMTAANLVQSDLIINAPYDSFALDFDGANDYISSNNIGISGLNNASVSVWVKPTGSTSSTYRSIVNQWEATNSAWGLWLNGTGSTYRIHWNQAGASGVNSGLIIPKDEWSHIAIVKNATTLKMFYNGSEVNSFSISAATGSGATILNIAAQYTSTSAVTFFNGNISNVSIYNSELSAAQVTTLYNEGKPFDLNTFEVTPVSWWRLGATNSSFDGSNWTVLDEISTSGNNGVSANMTQSDLVDGVGATGSGTSSGMSSGTNRTGDAPYSDNNAVSYNMSVTAKSTSVPT